MSIRAATTDDLPNLLRMRARAIDQIRHTDYQRKHLLLWRDADILDKYQALVQQQCLWVIGPPGNPIASSGLRLSTLELVAVFTDPKHIRQGLAKKLVAHAERVAVKFGILDLNCEASLNAVQVYRQTGYQGDQRLETCDRLGLPCLIMTKSLRRRQTAYQKTLMAQLTTLGISQRYGVEHALPIQTPPKKLVDAGQDCFDRQVLLTYHTRAAWNRMKRQALSDNIQLQLVSGFRDIDYQAGIIQRKLNQGQAINDILKVSAAPGFSEHHTGRAIDITTPDSDALEESFAQTTAYQWLENNADQFGFKQSYPRGNIHGIAWEPWHWCSA